MANLVLLVVNSFSAYTPRPADLCSALFSDTVALYSSAVHSYQGSLLFLPILSPPLVLLTLVFILHIQILISTLFISLFFIFDLIFTLPMFFPLPHSHNSYSLPSCSLILLTVDCKKLPYSSFLLLDLLTLPIIILLTFLILIFIFLMVAHPSHSKPLLSPI